jgi:hypothetical protein
MNVCKKNDATKHNKNTSRSFKRMLCCRHEKRRNTVSAIQPTSLSNYHARNIFLSIPAFKNNKHNEKDTATDDMHGVLRIRDVYLGSRIRTFSIPDIGSKKIPDPGSGTASKNLSIFNPKNCFQALGNMIRDVYSGSGSGY